MNLIQSVLCRLRARAADRWVMGTSICVLGSLGASDHIAAAPARSGL
jgi:hypothetical protein